MGFAQKNKKRKMRRQAALDGDTPGGEGSVKRMKPPRPQSHSESLQLQSEALEKAYRGTAVVPESEWDLFISTMQRPLPTTFRFQLGDADAHVAAFERGWVPALTGLKVGGEDGEPPVEVPAPRVISWVPGRRAWRVDVNRKYLRRDPTLKKFQKYLVASSDGGYTTRQEEVSMIPAVLLDARPGHRVIDLCAAPGSKTSQIIEAVGFDAKTGGVVIANDADLKRCSILIHQTLRRMNSPNLLVTNNDARHFPNVEDPSNPGVKQLFDRVLADVPCSGSGTFRKNVALWKQWKPSSEIGLHAMQVHIGRRAASLTKIGGRMVYSTCSISPIENEAVVAEILRSKPDMFLEKVSLPDLIARPGLSDWEFVDKHFGRYKTLDEVPEVSRPSYSTSMFPPTEEEAAEFNLDRCLRIMPQDMDTGGFFVAVFGRKDIADPAVAKAKSERRAAYEAQASENANDADGSGSGGDGDGDGDGEASGDAPNPDDDAAALPSTKRGPKLGDLNAPYRPTIGNPIVEAALAYFGVGEEFPRDLLLTRGDAVRKITYVSSGVRDVIAGDERRNKLRIVAAGAYVIKAPSKNTSVRENHEKAKKGTGAEDADPPAVVAAEAAAAAAASADGSVGPGGADDRVYRLVSEGLDYIEPFVKKCRVRGDQRDFNLLLDKELISIEEMGPAWKAEYDRMGANGPLIGVFDIVIPPLNVARPHVFSLWRASNGFTPQIQKTEIERLRGVIQAQKDMDAAEEGGDKKGE